MSMLIQIVEYNPSWAFQFERIAARIRSSLGPVMRSVDHVGSTAVPGLAAKPIIDTLLTVAKGQSKDECRQRLEKVGFILKHPAMDGCKGLMLSHGSPLINLHVFSEGCVEPERMLRFRDWLRNNSNDRTRYQELKLHLASCEWENIQAYANSKTSFIDEIVKAAAPNIRNACQPLWEAKDVWDVDVISIVNSTNSERNSC